MSCPDTPNCVSSQATGDQYIAPLVAPESTSKSNTPEIKQTLIDILSRWPRTEVTSNKNNIITAVISSRWMGFKDDLVLVVNNDESVDVRSSSRTGHYDFGVNRERVEELRGDLTR
ncbi:hypothetical protein ACH42_09400 [Endozoicomonas sp. (ex Bugula neritina AB1)]|nr:hypothetical protein ACH42_09400 [Endozoicomonas sp. (ex Bugula neritina AB1)]